MSTCYSACRTDSACLLGCLHEHVTVEEAVGCISCAGGYVVATENGVMRSLMPVEEAEFQRAISYRNDRWLAEAKQVGQDEETSADSRYAVMMRVSVGDVWTWTTWQVYATYEQAMAYASEGTKVVRFRSAEWAALRRSTEPALPSAATTPKDVRLHWHKGESLVEFVDRSLDQCGLAQQSAPPDVSHDFKPVGLPRRNDKSPVALVLLIDLIDLVLTLIDNWEISELERMHAKQVPMWLENLRGRARRALEDETAK